jgi:tetratricopeptide (TPR) repeat protein
MNQLRVRIAYVLLAYVFAAAGLSAQTSPLDLLKEADRAYRAQEIPKAVHLFEQALQADPSLTAAHMMLGIIQAQQNEAGKAARHFEAVLLTQPQNAAAHFFLARLARDKPDWPAAARHYRAALENNHPQREGILIELAVAEANLGEPAAALKRLDRLEPPSDPAKAAAYHAAAAIAHRRLDDPRRAMESLRKAIAATPENPGLREQWIETLIAAGEYAAALTEAIQAQRRFPDHAGIQYQFGIGGFYIRESPFTSLSLRNLRDVHPQDPRVLVLQGLDLLKSENAGAAIEVLRKGAAADVPQSRLFLAVALEDVAEYEEAGKVLQGIREERWDGNFHLTLGRVLAAQKRNEEALSPLRKAEAYMPTHPDVHLQLSRVYERIGKLIEANEHKNKWEQLQAARSEEF